MKIKNQENFKCQNNKLFIYDIKDILLKRSHILNVNLLCFSYRKRWV